MKKTHWLLDSLAIVAIVAVAINAYGQDDEKWFVAQRNGVCLRLGEEFPGMRTPDEAYARMNTDPSNPIRIGHPSPRSTIFVDSEGRQPPLIMVKGSGYCLEVTKRMRAEAARAY
jgi:hypothetical protein